MSDRRFRTIERRVVEAERRIAALEQRNFVKDTPFFPVPNDDEFIESTEEAIRAAIADRENDEARLS